MRGRFRGQRGRRRGSSCFISEGQEAAHDIARLVVPNDLRPVRASGQHHKLRAVRNLRQRFGGGAALLPQVQITVAGVHLCKLRIGCGRGGNRGGLGGQCGGRGFFRAGYGGRGRRKRWCRGERRENLRRCGCCGGVCFENEKLRHDIARDALVLYLAPRSTMLQHGQTRGRCDGAQYLCVAGGHGTQIQRARGRGNNGVFHIGRRRNILLKGQEGAHDIAHSAVIQHAAPVSFIGKHRNLRVSRNDAENGTACPSLCAQVQSAGDRGHAGISKNGRLLVIAGERQ